MNKKIYSKYNIIGVIQARGGSVRLPLKNIKYLAGKPLIAYIISAAKKSKYLRRIIVSTDHPKIKSIALKFGAEVPFKRPKNISGNCPSELVTQHAVRFIEKEEKRKIDIVVTLQPTTPFCLASDIDSCIELLLRKKDINSVFSAVTIHQRPEWMFKLRKDGKAKAYLPGSVRGARGVSQQLGILVVPNGGIYVTTRKGLFSEKCLIAKKTGAYLMPQERSVDIDEEVDFKFAEFLKKNLKVLK